MPRKNRNAGPRWSDALKPGPLKMEAPPPSNEDERPEPVCAEPGCDAEPDIMASGRHGRKCAEHWNTQTVPGGAA